MSEHAGAIITEGPTDWRIYQQGRDGTAEIAVAGTWHAPREPGLKVRVRLVHEDGGGPVTASLDWQPVTTRKDGTWSGVLKGVPAGGLYRLETQVRTRLNDHEWAHRGDTRRFLGVGELWVLAGQSNSAGYGKGPYHDPPALGVHLLTNALRWTLASHPLNDSTDTAHPANRDRANTGHSPWLTWAKRVRAALGVPVGLLQASLGGSALAPWNPAGEGESPLFEVMCQAVAAAGGSVRGVLWYQGCSDTPAESARTYEKRFIAAVKAWRKALKLPDLAVLTVQLNRRTVEEAGDDDRGWTLVREAQRRVPQELPGVTVTPALDLAKSDFIHNSPQGNLELAERTAAAALGRHYGRDVAYKAPEIASAAASKGGKAIDLAFENVLYRLCSLDNMAVPFRVEDGAGIVEILKVQYRGGGGIRLHLQRPLEGQAVVHGAWGANPPTVPFDDVRHMPMLGFHGFEVK